MGDKSSIQWTEATWNPVRGCSLVTAGCTNCYAMRQAHRFKSYRGLTRLTQHGPVWTGEVRVVPELLDQPLRWKRPRRIFVNSMSDLFHDSVPDDFIRSVFGIMSWSQRHVFQILTKRPDRMCQWMLKEQNLSDRFKNWFEGCVPHVGKNVRVGTATSKFPLPNVWLGVSCEDQETADERIPLLLQTPAAVRWVSLEPLLGPIDLFHVHDSPEFTFNALSKKEGIAFRGTGLDWVIVGGESGPRTRPLDIQWARDIVAQCRAAGVPCFVKQLGRQPFEKASVMPGDPDYFPGWTMVSHNGIREFYKYLRPKDRKGGDPEEWPEDLRVREYPLH